MPHRLETNSNNYCKLAHSPSRLTARGVVSYLIDNGAAACCSFSVSETRRKGKLVMHFSFALSNPFLGPGNRFSAGIIDPPAELRGSRRVGQSFLLA